MSRITERMIDDEFGDPMGYVDHFEKKSDRKSSLMDNYDDEDDYDDSEDEEDDMDEEDDDE